MRVRSEGNLPRRHPLLSNTSHALYQNNATSQETDRISFQNSTKAIGSWEGSLPSAARVKHAGSNVSSMQHQESSSPAGATGRQISEPDKKYYQDTRRGDDHKVTREVKADSTHTAQILLGVAKGREGGDMRGRDKLRTQAQTQAPGPANDKVALMSSDDGIRQGRNDSDDQGVSKAGPMEMLSLASTDRDSSARRQTSSGLDNKVPPRSAGVSDPANGNGGTWLTSTKNVELLCSKLSLNSSDSARWKRWKDLRCSCFSSSAASDFVACQFATLQPLANGLVELVRSMKLEVSGSSAMFHTKKILSFGTRVPGDEGWNKTIGYISGFFKALGWFVEEDRCGSSCFLPTCSDGSQVSRPHTVG
eukprot:760267-Hanusia_phi.AAC.14